MVRQPVFRLAMLLLGASRLGAQVTATAQDVSIQVSTAPRWTDSGLDLLSGDALEISATASPDPQSASGVPLCDPKGLSGTRARAADLPLPSASAGALLAQFHAHGASPVLVGASREFHIAEPSHLLNR